MQSSRVTIGDRRLRWVGRSTMTLLLFVACVQTPVPAPPIRSTPEGTQAVPGAGAEVSSRSEVVQIETVSFRGTLWEPLVPRLDTSIPTTIDAWLTVPAGAGPVPAVIIEHGCGGVRASNRQWADDLNDAGIAALVLDSFGGRDIEEVCSGRRTLSVASLIVDVYRAADLLRGDPDIDGSRLAVLGFSFGGRTALWSSQSRFQEAYGGDPFQAYVAFYPSTCFIQLRSESDVVGGPIRILHGTADDYTPIDQCEDMIGRMADAGVDADLLRYEDAHHGFDDRALASSVRFFEPMTPSPRSCTFVEIDGTVIDPGTGRPAGVTSRCVERGVTSAYDAAAREKASVDLIAFLDGVFRLDGPFPD